MTLPLLSREQADRLGLDGTQAGMSVLIPWPEPSEAEGASPAPVVLGLGVLLSGTAHASFNPIGLPAAERAGVTLELLEGQRTLRARAPAGSRVGVRAYGGDTTWGHPIADRSVALVDLESAGPCVLTLPSGDVLLLRATPDGLAFELRAVPPSEWLRSVKDEWLVDAMSRRLQRGTPWDQAVAASMYARLSLDVDQARAVMEQTLAGGRPDSVRWPARWIRSLPDATLATIEDESLRLCATARADLAKLEDARAPQEPGWRQQLGLLARTRDDIEGVLFLLRQTDCGARLAAVLPPIDESADLLVDSLVVPIRLDDEQLRRTAGTDPTAWWSRLAV
jgi:hypothetical protein